MEMAATVNVLSKLAGNALQQELQRVSVYRTSWTETSQLSAQQELPLQ